MLNRDGLSILLHPGTDAYADHIDHAVWLGSVLPVLDKVFTFAKAQAAYMFGARA
jgi:aromatic ring-cleaving dioxygenase